MANVSDWSANEKDNLFLDELNLSDQHGRRTAKIMAAVKAKEDEQDAKLDAVAGGLVFRGTKATYVELEAVEDPAVGDMYSVTGLGGENYAWNGEAWDALGTSDSNVVHKSNNETITGYKVFTTGPGITATNPIVGFKCTSIEAGGALTNNDISGMYFRDKNDKNVGFIQQYCRNDKTSSNISLCCLDVSNSTPETRAQVTIKIEKDQDVFNRVIFPSIDDAVNFGSSENRWKDIYASNDTIQTSDENEKCNIESFPDAVLDAWEEVDFVQFNFKTAVEKKGEAARLHGGIIAQRVKDVFERHGLDAFRYGLLCRDSWGAETWDETVEASPGVMAVEHHERSAGERWSIRYCEALCLEAACHRRMVARLESRLSALENHNGN